ncbi:ribosomal protein S12 methylthiotransferase accessory factor [Streptomyces misionensis]|uniref:Ribosomal protein S12 methylthiotransferase accessory factor n=1 Tax=Streptomyces misionensis TaxID=67331 RepID=A0A1H4IB06_9ACTN|nr:TOMM precursor leader peptide-binding protein [Streptomyces misionensis]SEB31120.1 ribosomal protein S12 methylthiotransferase accessory factor [Streptomyces misionensis]
MNVAGGNAGTVRIGFKPHLRPQVVAEDGVYLVSERGVTTVPGTAMARLAPLLDGTRDMPALLREAAPELDCLQVGELVGQLTRSGLLDHRAPQHAPCDDRAAEAYWEIVGGERVRRAAGRPMRLRLTEVADVDPARTEAVRTACRDAGITVVDDPADDSGDTALDLVVCEDYLDPRLAGVDAAHRATGRPWLLAKPYGSTVWIGPVFRPGESACWHCLAHRLRGRRAAQSSVPGHAGDTALLAPRAALPVTVALGAGLAALECAKWLAGNRHDAQDYVVTFDTLGPATRRHRLAHRPQCSECGNPRLAAERAGQPVRLESRPKASRGGGGHRALPPRAVLERYGDLVSPVTGVLKEIRRDERGPDLLNVYRAGYNQALGPRRMAERRTSLRQESAGKGRTALEARVGALCEGVERISGTWQGDEARVRGSLRSLGDRAMSPLDVQLWHERQYRERDTWNTPGHPFHLVPERFDEDAVLDWTPVWSLTRGRHLLLPSALLYYNAPDPVGRRMTRADSNGCAAGSTVEDAALQGLLELVERDAVALWWYNRTRQPAVDMDAFGDPWTARVEEAHAALGREVWVLDLTSDLGVPVMTALSRRTDEPAGAGEDIVFGFGAHPDPAVALCRALSEMNQLLPAVLDAGPDGTGYTCSDPVALEWWRTARRGTLPYLAPDRAVRPRTPGDYGYRPTADLLDDIDALRHRLEERGMEVLLLDQTQPDLRLPVVRVIVPGLRHFWPRFAPGRLYDVPVELGRLAAPTPYDDLNPVPLFV